MKKKYLTILLLSIIILITALLFETKICFSKKQTNFEIITLLDNGLYFPKNWQSRESTVTSFIWGESETKTLEDDHVTMNSEEVVWRIWFEKDEVFPPRIVQTIYKYKTPLFASLYFWRFNPKIHFYNQWPNLNCLFCKKEESKPKSLNNSRMNADDLLIVCGMGNSESCQLWFAWARYENIIMSFEFYAPNLGMNETVFFEVFSKVDEELSRKIDFCVNH